ncbi:MAG: DUF2156 domain-containing protein [Lawsonibacter sp.]|nr:DUF2156 domain-containing protein [Lawsonibacter sp.]
MLNFQPLQLEDLPKLRAFFSYSGSRICDTTPGTIFIWRDMYQTAWAVYDGSLYFKVVYPGLGETFTLPLGGGRPEHFREIAGYCCRRNMPISFYPVPKDELERLQQFFPNSAAIAERDSFDYLYRAEDLKYFRGKKLSGQRNHVNKFLKTYGNWTFRPITPEDIPAVKAFLDQYAQRWGKSAASFSEDIAKTHEVLDNHATYDLLGGMLLVEDQLVGFSLGEVVGDTLFTHIEKADRDYEGCYQMLVAQFAQQFAREGVAFINREDDTGDAGLRTSKLSYHPVALLEKYTVTVEEPCGYACPL